MSRKARASLAITRLAKHLRGKNLGCFFMPVNIWAAPTG